MKTLYHLRTSTLSFKHVAAWVCCFGSFVLASTSAHANQNAELAPQASSTLKISRHTPPRGFYSADTIDHLDDVLERLMTSQRILRAGKVSSAKRSNPPLKSTSAGAVTVYSRIVDAFTQRPINALVLVSLPNVSASELLANYERRLVTDEQLASQLSWHGFTSPSGSFTVHNIPRETTLTGVVLAAGYRAVPFSVKVRKLDSLRVALYPIQMKR